MINPATLHDDELAACCDEYFKRAADLVGDKRFHFHVMAIRYYNDDFTIDHTAEVGEKQKVTGNNLIEAARRCVARLREDETIAPTEVRKCLPAPDLVPQVDEVTF